MVAELELTQGYVVKDTLGVSKSSVFAAGDFSLNLSIPTASPPRCREDGAAASPQRLVQIKGVTLKEKEEKERKGSRTKEEETCSNGREEELSLDSHVVIRYHRGLVLIGQPIRVSVNLRNNFSAEFVIIR